MKTFLLVCFSLLLSICLASGKPGQDWIFQNLDFTAESAEIDVRKELSDIKILLNQQRKEIRQQERKQKQQDEAINRQASLIQNLSEDLKAEKDANVKQAQSLEKYAEITDGIERTVRRSMLAQSDPAPYQTTIVGCLYDVLNMSCSDGHILITNATYGQYFSACPPQTCCDPDFNSDCVENFDIESPQSWAELRLACNYRSYCEFQHQAFVISRCEAVADYLSVTYTCFRDGSVGPATDPVAFTAYTTTTRSYSAGDRLIFESTLTNIGGYYNSSTNSFTCPFNGLYMFTINVMSDDVDYMRARMLMDGELLLSSYSDNDSAHDSHAGNFLFTNCNAGQEVWIEAKDTGSYMSSSSDRESSFSGYLVNRN